MDKCWTEYRKLESQFKDIVDNYIPLIEKHKDVTSPRLAELSSIIGGWVETAWKRMEKSGYPPHCPTIDNIDTFREVFEQRYHLSKQRVRVLPNDYDIVKPFEELSKSKNPKWFRTYSKHKHNRVMLQNLMTLDLVTRSLAGLFLLNVFPLEMREYALKKGIIYSKWGKSKSYDTGSAMTETLLSHPHTLRGKYLSFVGHIMAETSIFRFEFRRWMSKDDPKVYPSEL